MLLIVALHYKYCSAQLMLTKKSSQRRRNTLQNCFCRLLLMHCRKEWLFVGPTFAHAYRQWRLLGKFNMKQVWTAQAATNLRLVITSLPFLKWQNTDNAQHQQQHNLRCA